MEGGDRVTRTEQMSGENKERKEKASGARRAEGTICNLVKQKLEKEKKQNKTDLQPLQRLTETERSAVHH